jgi:hypothetical protein
MAADDSHRKHGVVLIPVGAVQASQHVRATQLWLGRRLARLLGLEFLGEHDPARHSPERLYLVPTGTVIGVQRARRLGIRRETDFFGGVVPEAFMATKAITHPLLAPGARAPRGWSEAFAQRVRDAVLTGFTVFSVDDAHRAGLHLLARGPVRIKSVRAEAGKGQWTATDTAELERVLNAVAGDDREVANHGLVLEEHLEEVRTYSVGQVRIGRMIAAYCGVQRLTRDNEGAQVYGGSDLMVTNGGFERLLGLDLPAEMQHAVSQARIYDAATACYPNLLASRRNYDVACGRDAQGHHRTGVLEQSWRIGGASSAEVAAVEQLRSAEAPAIVRASSVEVYGRHHDPPPGATILFSGDDADAGPLTKYVTVTGHDRE